MDRNASLEVRRRRFEEALFLLLLVLLPFFFFEDVVIFDGVGGLTTHDGRVLIMMRHPERVFRTLQYSWHPKNWGEYGPWIKFFANAKDFVS